MARVYSARLFEDIALGGGASTVLGTAPDDAIWVVRHMTATFVGDISGPLVGFVVDEDTTCPLWTVGPFGVRPNFSYTWAGRHVAPSGSSLSFSSSDEANWAIIGSGYLLQLP